MEISSIQNSYTPSIRQQDTATGASSHSTNEPENKNTNSAKQEISTEFGKKQEGELSKNEIRIIAELEKVDQAVKRHEMAHMVAGGRFILSGANYSYKTGPDGKQYAVAGEVSIDTSPIPGDPQATIDKMQQIRNAALAPVDPSAQDRKVASRAMTISTKATSELMLNRVKEKASSDEEKAFGHIKQTADDAYIKIQNIRGNQQESTFKISA
ncbi:MAG: SprA-related family protein [Desulfobacteraceae bacterium]|nr:SprA-related family protein [Desulfobacteraceae bacterium]